MTSIGSEKPLLPPPAILVRGDGKAYINPNCHDKDLVERIRANPSAYSPFPLASTLPRRSETNPVLVLNQPLHPPSYHRPFDPPCTVNLDEIDIITQSSITELFQEHLAKQLDLILIRIPTTKKNFKIISLPQNRDNFESMFRESSGNYFTREPWGTGHDVIFFLVETRKVKNPNFIEAYRIGTLADLNTQRKHNPEPTGNKLDGSRLLNSICKIYSPKKDNTTTNS